MTPAEIAIRKNTNSKRGDTYTSVLPVTHVNYSELLHLAKAGVIFVRWRFKTP